MLPPKVSANWIEVRPEVSADLSADDPMQLYFLDGPDLQARFDAVKSDGSPEQEEVAQKAWAACHEENRSNAVMMGVSKATHERMNALLKWFREIQDEGPDFKNFDSQIAWAENLCVISLLATRTSQILKRTANYKMRTFTCTTFLGAWPVGTAAALKAVDAESAASLLNKELLKQKIGRGDTISEVTAKDMVELKNGEVRHRAFGGKS